MCPVISTELKILIWIQDIFSNPILDKFFIFISSIGNLGMIWIILGIVLLFTKKYRNAGFLILTSLLMSLFITNIFLKNYIARIRPFDVYKVSLLIKAPTDFSFPSGHTSAAFAAALTFMHFNKKIGIYFVILAVLIGISRLYLFVHYPTDVIAGGIIGILISDFVYYLFLKLKKSKEDS